MSGNVAWTAATTELHGGIAANAKTVHQPEVPEPVRAERGAVPTLRNDVVVRSHHRMVIHDRVARRTGERTVDVIQCKTPMPRQGVVLRGVIKGKGRRLVKRNILKGVVGVAIGGADHFEDVGVRPVEACEVNVI